MIMGKEDMHLLSEEAESRDHFSKKHNQMEAPHYLEIS